MAHSHMTPENRQFDCGQRIYLETFGCQMNELDSELVQSQLSALGYAFSDDRDTADVVLFNTCSVRQQAENKVLSRVGELGIEKSQGRALVLGLLGCLSEREGVALLHRHPQIDFLCGPGELDKLPLLLQNASQGEAQLAADRAALQGNRSRRSTVLGRAEDGLESLDRERSFDPDSQAIRDRSAYVRITRGCNKFCTYCVVPATRGAEVHRPPEAIVSECQKLADAGVIEVTLIGQTVNHYTYTHGMALSAEGEELPQVGPGGKAFENGVNHVGSVTSFADLLRRVHDEVPAIERLRFVTSYPRDFGDDILEAMRDCERICRYLHVPAQSGSNAVLSRMNRGYTVEEYEDFVARARAMMPDISIAGDIIVGFCGETEDDFRATSDLLRRVRFKNNFIFRYSPRPGTAAMSRLEDDVPEETKRQRINDLLSVQSEISAEVHAALKGQTVSVFVQRVSPQSSKVVDGGIDLLRHGGGVQVSGRTRGDLICVFDLPQDIAPEQVIGSIVEVEIVDTGPLVLRGISRSWQSGQESGATGSELVKNRSFSG
jgi:tRNA-2-methylthio-N6-dimethylallyladenosine synthase